MKKYIIILSAVIAFNFFVYGQDVPGGNTKFSGLTKLSLNGDKHSALFLIDKDKNSLFFILNDTTKKDSSKKYVKLMDKKKYKIHPVRAIIMGSALVLSYAAMEYYFNNTWWTQRSGYFKFSVDDLHARDVNKVSHAYTSDMFAVGSAYLYEWVGFKPITAQIFGSLTSFVYETYLEYNDGLSPDWGFDIGDEFGNVIGVVYPVVQKLVPFLQEINMKWSCQPSLIVKKTQNTLAFIDDYDLMTYWLSINPKKLLPKSIGKYYPGFLCLALGISLKGAQEHAFLGNQGAYRVLYIALDYDLRYLPGNSDFLKKLKSFLNFYHFPSPAIRISPNKVWYGLFF